MTPKLRAALIHVLTASGAAFGLLGLLAAASAEWTAMFAWLGIALLVDGIDGPLARRYRVAEILPRWSGERLDQIVDYITYIAVPAFALAKADLLPEPFRVPAAIAVLLSSLFHMADLKCKTDEGYFVGFPAIWNILLLYLFALMPPPIVSLAVVLLFVALTFVPILCVHPFRVSALRPLTMLATALWALAAIGAVLNPFPSPPWVQILLVATGLWFAGVGLFRGWRVDGAT